MFTDEHASIEKEYGKHPNITAEDMQGLRKWLTQQPHLPHEYITDLDLLLAYHCCECQSELTKKVIDLNYTLRTLLTFYKNRRADERLEAAFRTWLITPLHMLTNNGCSTIYCQLLDVDPKYFVYKDVVRAFVMIMDFWQSEEGSVPGVAIIVNMDKVSLGHLSRVDLSVAQQFFYFLQEAMFFRLKEFHFINAPSFMDSLINMVRPFMKKEMLNLLKVHQVGSNTLDEFIPTSALPLEAGGEYMEGFMLRDKMWEKIKENEKFFIEESKKRVDETKRPGGPKTMSSFFRGMEENFKSLEID